MNASEKRVEVDEICSQKCACGGTFTCGQEVGGVAVVLHTEPHCDWFANASMNDYVEALDDGNLTKMRAWMDRS